MSDGSLAEGAAADYEGSDPGMAAERTDLAWSRSGLALGACGVIVLKVLPSITGNPRQPLIGAAILLLGAITWALGYWSSHQRRPQPGRPRPVATWRDLAPAAYAPSPSVWSPSSSHRRDLQARVRGNV